jgi:hypothetical protein
MNYEGTPLNGNWRAEKTCFFTMARSHDEEKHARFLIRSLRAFGGELCNCPVLVFRVNLEGTAPLDFGFEDVHVMPLEVDKRLRDYWFGAKVTACFTAEALVGGDVRSLVWMNSQCLIVNPPDLFDLGTSLEAALRPVHIKNIGLSVHEPGDDFWKGIYQTVGVDEGLYDVETFIERDKIRPYFNSHLFSINPSKGVLRIWLEKFMNLVVDQDFQTGPCRDQTHQIFLHQAVLSALITKMIDWKKIYPLPAEYSYPMHLHQQVPLELRPPSLNSLVCPVYEGVYQHPDTLNGLNVQDPLETWILENMPDEG